MATAPLDGNVIIVGSAEGTIDLGLGELSASATDAFVASYSP